VLDGDVGAVELDCDSVVLLSDAVTETLAVLL
jgi:hypothetical protein